MRAKHEAMACRQRSTMHSIIVSCIVEDAEISMNGVSEVEVSAQQFPEQTVEELTSAKQVIARAIEIEHAEATGEEVIASASEI